MYKVRISSQAVKELDKISAKDFERIDDRILSLEINPRPMGSIKLKDENIHRVRVGNYRILYEIDEKNKIVDVYKVSHRKDVYRK